MDNIFAENFKENPNLKPTIELSNDIKVSNTYKILSKCSVPLNKFKSAYEELYTRVFNAKNFSQSVCLIEEYVNII